MQFALSSFLHLNTCNQMLWFPKSFYMSSTESHIYFLQYIITYQTKLGRHRVVILKAHGTKLHELQTVQCPDDLILPKILQKITSLQNLYKTTFQEKQIIFSIAKLCLFSFSHPPFSYWLLITFQFKGYFVFEFLLRHSTLHCRTLWPIWTKRRYILSSSLKNQKNCTKKNRIWILTIFWKATEQS